MYRTGELDQRIKIMYEVKTPDGMGGNTVALVERFDVWAKAKPLGGNESSQFERVNAHNNYIFVIRNTDQIEESDHLIWNDISYNIRSLKSYGNRSMYLEIEAERGVAQ